MFPSVMVHCGFFWYERAWHDVALQSAMEYDTTCEGQAKDDMREHGLLEYSMAGSRMICHTHDMI